jgi:hypothetical protein
MIYFEGTILEFSTRTKENHEVLMIARHGSRLELEISLIQCNAFQYTMTLDYCRI